MGAAVQYQGAVDRHVREARCKLPWLLEGGVLRHGLGIEDHEVGPEALADLASVRDAQPPGREAAELADRLFQADRALLADIALQDPGVRPIRARVDTA